MQAVANSTTLHVPAGTALKRGRVYLRLYHGRTDPSQQMEGWGFTGPTFGPLVCYVQTYCNIFRLHGDSAHDELWLDSYDDMIVWDGCYFGDMEVFVAGPNDKG